MSKTVLSVESLSKSFKDVKALREVDIEVDEGEIFGFLGPNGAGKTTTIRCIMDYMRPEKGKISLFNKGNLRDNPQLKANIGYISADTQLYGSWTGTQHIDFMFSQRSDKQNAKKIAKRLELDLKKKSKALSSGNKQKLSITLAFASSPKLLVMDEPTRGLDPLLQLELYDMIRKHAVDGNTIFFSSHNLPEVQRVCSRVAVIKKGKVISTENLEDLLELKSHIVRAVTKRPAATSEFKMRGVKMQNKKGKEITLKVHGAIEPVLSRLEKLGIVDLEITHANLEDIFMEFYDD